MEYLTGKVVLVSIRRINAEGEEAAEAFFGTVQSQSENTVQLRLDDGELRSLPYDEDAYEPAERGVYKLEDGSVCEDPDFTVSWVVYTDEEAWKRYGDQGG